MLKQTEPKKNNSHFSGTVATMLLLLILLIASGILMTVFSSAVKMSRESKALNHAVTLCRSAGEVFSSTGSAEETASTLGGSGGELYFDGDLNPASEDSAEYILTIETSSEATSAGEMITAVFTVRAGGEDIYTYEVKHYSKEAAE